MTSPWPADHHAQWRSAMHAAWRRAGIGKGQRVIDLACGSGRTTLELADLVGPSGRVLAYDLSPLLVDDLRTEARERGLLQVVAAETDLNDADLGLSHADAIWCRWFAAFVDQPDALLDRCFHALVPGGLFISHEYLEFGSWRRAPAAPALDLLPLTLAQAWGDDQDEPPDGFEVPVWLAQLGFDLIDVRPISDSDRGGPLAWQWPRELVDDGLRRLVDQAAISDEEVDGVRRAFDEREAAPHPEPARPGILEVRGATPMYASAHARLPSPLLG